jgi:hypothetical protein
MRSRFPSAIGACALLLSSAVNGGAQVRNGVQTGRLAGVPSVPAASRASVPGHIDFDDATAPCTFDSAVALTGEYGGIGVVFSGPGGLDGGAILDQCGGFGVTGHSPPNFLAFNTGSVLSNGGIPQGPETLTFSQTVDTVAVNAGHGQAGTITLECFTGGGVPVGSQSVVGLSALQPLSVTAAGQIGHCVLSFTGTVAVFDDLTYDPPVPVELQSLVVE